MSCFKSTTPTRWLSKACLGNVKWKPKKFVPSYLHQLTPALIPNIRSRIETWISLELVSWEFFSSINKWIFFPMQSSWTSDFGKLIYSSEKTRKIKMPIIIKNWHPSNLLKHDFFYRTIKSWWKEIFWKKLLEEYTFLFFNECWKLNLVNQKRNQSKWP